MNPIGCNSDQLKDIMLFCGYEEINLNIEKKLYFFKQKKILNQKNTKQNKNKSKLKSHYLSGQIALRLM